MPDIYLGWSEIHIGETTVDGMASDTAWQTFGFDLDGVCTNSSTCPSEQDQQSCQSPTDHIPYDGDLCRDNTFASLAPVAAAAPTVGQQFGISEAIFNCNLWRGTYNVVLKISGYNGQPDDSQVRVDLYMADGLQRTQTFSCPLDNFKTMYPRWQVSDPWKIDRGNLTADISKPGVLPDSKVADPHAYVRGGYLVVEFPDPIELRLAGDNNPYRGFDIIVQRPLFVGNLVRQPDTTWQIRDGIAAGRVLSADLIKSFRQIGLCHGTGNDSVYDSVVNYIQNNADVLADGTVDRKRSCDAMSLGIGFKAAQLEPGMADTASPLVECCAPGKSTDYCFPMCGDGKVTGSEACDTAIAAGQSGACPTSCSSSDPCAPQMLTGTACSAECVTMPITAVGPKDGCCPKGASASADADCPSMCGNGVVEPKETCDPSSSCPSCKVDSNACLKGSVSAGSANTCDLVCSYNPVGGCQNGDNCCPSGCNLFIDSDCSATCGNGVIEANETCEAGSKTPCPNSCDDGDPCTQDYRTGSPQNCNVVCTHIAISAPVSGDKCCPKGATAISDSDCMAVCGNGKVEGNEQCDDGNTVSNDGCSADCKLESSSQLCLSKLGKSDACAMCTCQNCSSQALACYGASDATDVSLCKGLVDCGRSMKCSGTSCYCGNADLATCVAGMGSGPCKSQVEMAAKSAAVADVLARSSDSSYPLGRANALSQCASSNCATECGLSTQ